MSRLHSWLLPTEPLTLAEGEVHVWRADLNVGAAELGSLKATLSSDELHRARQFYFDQGRMRFIAARGILRDILGRYVPQAPDILRFDYSRFGKPSLHSATGIPPLQFNLCHSQEIALYAVARGRELGIDVEQIRPEFSQNRIAENSFSPAEAKELRALPPEQQPRAFFNCWTRKEAYVKARGEGLQIPLHSFDVSLRPGDPARFLRGSAPGWSLRELDPQHDYVAAAAVEGDGWDLKLWQWQPTR